MVLPVNILSTMSINDFWEKIKPFYTLLLIVVVASIFFAIGRLSVIESRKTPLRVIVPNQGQTGAVANAQSGSLGLGVSSNNTSETDTGGAVVGSKSGKKYYYPWCGGLKRVKPENQVPFASIADARAAGYTPAGNCKGLK